MKRIIIMLSMCISFNVSASSKLEVQIAIFESSCVDYFNSVIDRKLGDNDSPENRKKWENSLFKDYRLAKDADVPDAERMTAIKAANLSCNVQQKLGI